MFERHIKGPLDASLMEGLNGGNAWNGDLDTGT